MSNEHGADRRVDRQHAIQRAVDAAVARAMRDAASLKKNGETWRQYFLNKWFTPAGLMIIGQGIAIVFMAVFTLGSRWEKMDASATDARAIAQGTQERTRQILEQHQMIIDEMRLIRQQNEVLGQEQQRSATRMTVMEKNLDAVVNRVQATPTRRELQGIVNQQLVPQLNRIEKRTEP